MRASLLVLGSFLILALAEIDARYAFIAMSRRRRSRNKSNGYVHISRQEKRKKCNYVNQLFPFSGNTCSSPPAVSYKHLYDHPYQSQLWLFQQQNCIPIFSERDSNILSILILFIALVFAFIV